MSNPNSSWPSPKFSFSVSIGKDLTDIHFQEVSGLDVEPQVTEYRQGNNPLFSTVKMPGLTKFSNVTLKKGLFPDDQKFQKWLAQIKMNTISRQTVTIRLLNESGQAEMVWTLQNASPTKITIADSESLDSDVVAVETLELAHEGMSITANDAV